INGVVVRWFKFDESYSHGLLVLGISVYLFGRNIKALWPLRIVPNYLALVGLLGASGVWAICHAMHLQVLEEFLLPIILWFGICSMLGWRQSQALIVPVGFLYFAIPFWDYAAYPLQLLTVEVNELVLELIGITAIIEGVFVELPGLGVFEVAHGCSGLRYLVVGLTLTTLFGYLNYSRWSNRIGIMALGVFLSLLA